MSGSKEEIDPFEDDPFGDVSEESEAAVEGAEEGEGDVEGDGIQEVQEEAMNGQPPLPRGRGVSGAAGGVNNPYVGDVDVQYEISHKYAKPVYQQQPKIHPLLGRIKIKGKEKKLGKRKGQKVMIKIKMIKMGRKRMDSVGASV